ncbi:GNAT family N-acetyltransferase [Pseudonocardia spinosispora]|uniref:GNAT family N-acetyltransferase n=1 Tax=Pseudonocardia spinosispora TaxID=103441 RepID=UPI00056D94A4|nr:GNAT family N-acetyltransferase [Pseudonocardia spinosispora]
MSAVIRPAEVADLPRLARLRAQWTDEVADEAFEERLTEWFLAEEDSRTVFVAEQPDGELVGMMSLVLFERMPTPSRAHSCWGYLSNALVVAECRDQGLGAALLDTVMAHARAAGCVRVVLSPTERAVPFYERGGFGPATMLMAQVLSDRGTGGGSGHP